jgi:predicted O-methyltransferase YrrM
MYPNWFYVTGKYHFEKLLSQYKDEPNLNYLQIGVFTGDASIWLMENVLTHSSSKLTDVDTWQGSDEEVHHDMDFIDIEKTYDFKTIKYHRIKKVKERSSIFLANCKDTFDFIYIDGDHTASAVLIDALLSWNLLKVGGIIAFDDYQWDSPKGLVYTPKMGVNMFDALYKNSTELIGTGAQVWYRKTQ